MRLIRNQLALSLSVAAGITLLHAPALAGSYHSASVVYGPAQSHDDPFDGHVLWIEYEGSDGSVHRATALRVNQWYGLTAAHVFVDADGTYSNHVVGNGENYFDDLGETRTIVDFGPHPSWSGTYTQGLLSDIDLAWFRFDSEWEGPEAVFGSIELGESAIVPEFGNPATGSGGYLPVDGERRAFDAPIDGFGRAGAFSSSYLVSGFEPLLFRNMPMAGMGTPGTSGAP